jgi:predicted MPP superfamily phosphohydrolase
MKTIAIGDVHGRSIWKEIVKKEHDFDVCVFIGDYFDSHHGGYSANRQIKNFKDILEFKRKNADKVILLTGNHSFHYIKGVGERYAGFQHTYAIDIGEIIHLALQEDLMQMCYIQDNFLFSHAGITKTWCKNNEIDMENVEQSINDLFKYKPNSFKFTPGVHFNNYGDDVTQSPIWVRPKSLREDKIDGFIQVVGHTVQNTLITSGEVILIDTLGTSEEYLEINNGVLTAKK